jgi:hypothetical protein
MATRFQVVFDCADPDRMTSFWANALGYKLMDPPAGFDDWPSFWRSIGVPEEELNGATAVHLVDPDGVGPRIFFQEVPEPKVVKNRLHLDLDAGGGRAVPLATRRQRVEAEADRLAGPRGQRVLHSLVRPLRRREAPMDFDDALEQCLSLWNGSEPSPSPCQRGRMGRNRSSSRSLYSSARRCRAVVAEEKNPRASWSVVSTRWCATSRRMRRSRSVSRLAMRMLNCALTTSFGGVARVVAGRRGRGGMVTSCGARRRRLARTPGRIARGAKMEF